MSERQRDNIVIGFAGDDGNDPPFHFRFTSSSKKWDDDDIEEMQEDKRAVSADPSYHADYCSGDTGVWYTYMHTRAEKSDFWKSISKAAAQGALNRF